MLQVFYLCNTYHNILYLVAFTKLLLAINFKFLEGGDLVTAPD